MNDVFPAGRGLRVPVVKVTASGTGITAVNAADVTETTAKLTVGAKVSDDDDRLIVLVKLEKVHPSAWGPGEYRFTGLDITVPRTSHGGWLSADETRKIMNAAMKAGYGECIWMHISPDGECRNTYGEAKSLKHEILSRE